MPKRKSRTSPISPQSLGVLAISALVLFAIGEGVRYARSDAGQLAIARTTGLGARADLTRIVSRQLRAALTSVAVPQDSVVESTSESGPAPVRWRIGVHPNASLLQANYAVTRALEDHGATVLSASERWTEEGAEALSMVVGLPRRPTHEIVLVRGRADPRTVLREPARLALVLYGFGDDAAQADSFLALAEPFAMAIVPGTRAGERMILHAREHDRELVLHLPLEPINYPRLNPGPGTVLVSMKPGQITGLVRHYLDQAGPVAAVANHMGSLATQDMTVMTAIYRELRRRRVPFLHVTPAAGAVCKSLAADMGVLYGEPNEIVDGEARGSETRVLDRRWNEVLKEAHARGHLVVMLRATPATWRWLPRALAAKRLSGVTVVPLASLLGKPAVL